MNRKGVDAIVATVLVILITIAAVAIIWAVVIPMIKDSMKDSSSSKAELVIDSSGKYTTWDQENSLVRVQVNRGNDNLSLTGIEFIFTTNGISTKIISDKIVQPNGQMVYEFPLGAKPDSISIAPITESGVGAVVSTTSTMSNYVGSDVVLLAGAEVALQGTTITTYSDCYQESADIPNQTGIDGSCGLIYGGSYLEWLPNGIDMSKYHNGNWSDVMQEQSSVPQAFYVNYTKPSQNFSGASWKIAPFGWTNNNLSGYVATVPLRQSCLNYDSQKIILRIKYGYTIVHVSQGFMRGTKTIFNQFNQFQCFDGSWNTFYTANSPKLFLLEEAMIWNISTTINADAACGLSVNSCSAGNLQDINDSSSEYLWNCLSVYGGSDATCRQAILPNVSSAMGLIPGGSFMMGATSALEIHNVTLSSFYMDKYEVTKAKWDEVKNWASTHSSLGYSITSGRGKALTHPVQYIQWYHAVVWSNARSEMEGLKPVYYTDANLTTVYRSGTLNPYVDWNANGYRLPTEAEWEYAAKGGNTNNSFAWSDSNNISFSRANYYSMGNATPYDEGTLGYHPLYNDGVMPYTSPVGNFAPNVFGLYDMTGNVFEWVWDLYVQPYSAAPVTNPHGPLSTPQNARVARGGDWEGTSSNHGAYVQKVTYRAISTGPTDFLGFRNVRNYIPTGMVSIPAGTFAMGASYSPPIHNVTLSAFYMDKYEVTNETWFKVKTWATNNGYNIAFAKAKAPNHPVQNMQWYTTLVWSNARSEMEGLKPVYYTDANLTTVYRNGSITPYVDWNANGYRLPTEAEWEYAARGGLVGMRFPWADSNNISHARANYYSCLASVWDEGPEEGYHPTYAVGGFPYTSPVGVFAPNGYGLYDMAGNVFEWCWDLYSTNYPTTPSTNPHGSTTGSARVVRGGSWGSNYPECSYLDFVDYRALSASNGATDYVGLRNVRNQY